MTLSKMTIFLKNDDKVIQNAKMHLSNIQEVLNSKGAKSALTMTFEAHDAPSSFRFDTKTGKGILVSAQNMDADQRPRLRSSGLNDQEIDVIFGFFFQNFIVPQLVYEAILSNSKASPNPSYYLATYESVLCAYHYWKDESDLNEQIQVLALVKKILTKVKNPVPENQITSIYLADNHKIIESDFINWLHLQAYILNDITEYVEHTSFADYIAYLLEDLK